MVSVDRLKAVRDAGVDLAKRLSEIEVLKAWAKKRPAEPILLGQAVRLVAHLGGYLGRANDPPAGHQLMWQGYVILQMMCEEFAPTVENSRME